MGALDRLLTAKSLCHYYNTERSGGIAKLFYPYAQAVDRRETILRADLLLQLLGLRQILKDSDDTAGSAGRAAENGSRKTDRDSTPIHTR